MEGMLLASRGKPRLYRMICLLIRHRMARWL